MPPLVLVGPGSHWASGGAIASPRIHATGYLETPEIRALMAAPVASVLPSLEEVAAGSATLVNPLDTASIATGIERLLDDPGRAEEQRRKGIEASQRFDWDRAAEQTLAFYRRVLGA